MPPMMICLLHSSLVALLVNYGYTIYTLVLRSANYGYVYSNTLLYATYDDLSVT